MKIYRKKQCESSSGWLKDGAITANLLSLYMVFQLPTHFWLEKRTANQVKTADRAEPKVSTAAPTTNTKQEQ
jgi:hypothetical protein